MLPKRFPIKLEPVNDYINDSGTYTGGGTGFVGTPNNTTVKDGFFSDTTFNDVLGFLSGGFDNYTDLKTAGNNGGDYDYNTNPYPEKPSNTSYIIGAVIVLVVVIGAYFLLRRKRKA